MDHPEHKSPSFGFARNSLDDDGQVGVGPLNPEAEDLVDRCTLLLDEVEAFQRSLRRNKQEKGVELRHFQGSVKSELRGLQMVCLVLSHDLILGLRIYLGHLLHILFFRSF